MLAPWRVLLSFAAGCTTADFPGSSADGGADAGNDLCKGAKDCASADITVEGSEIELGDVTVIFLPASFGEPAPVALRELPDDAVALPDGLESIHVPVQVEVFGQVPQFTPILRYEMDEPKEEDALLAHGTVEVDGEEPIDDYHYTFYSEGGFHVVLPLPDPYEKEDSAGQRRYGPADMLEAKFETALGKVEAGEKRFQPPTQTYFDKRESSTSSGRLKRFDRIAIEVHGILSTTAQFERNQLDEDLQQRLVVDVDDKGDERPSTSPIRIAEGWTSTEFAQAPGRFPYQRIWLYEYNWTEPIDQNGCALASLIEQQVTDSPPNGVDPCQVVDIFAHSMGALVSRDAFLRWGGEAGLPIAHFTSMAGVNGGTPSSMTKGRLAGLTLDALAFLGTYVARSVARGTEGELVRAPVCRRSGPSLIDEPGVRSLRWESGWSNSDLSHACWTIQSAGLLGTLTSGLFDSCKTVLGEGSCGYADDTATNPLVAALNATAPASTIDVATIVGGEKDPGFSFQQLINDYVQCIFRTAAVAPNDSIVPVVSQAATGWTGVTPLNFRVDRGHSQVPDFIGLLLAQDPPLDYLQQYWRWLHNNEGPYQIEMDVPTNEQSLRPPVSTDEDKPIVLCPYSHDEVANFPEVMRVGGDGYASPTEVRLGARVFASDGLTTPTKYRGPLGVDYPEDPPEGKLPKLQVVAEERSACTDTEAWAAVSVINPDYTATSSDEICAVGLGQRRQCRDVKLQRQQLTVDAPQFAEVSTTDNRTSIDVTVEAPADFLGTLSGTIYCFGNIHPDFTCPTAFTPGEPFSVDLGESPGEVWVCAQADEDLCGSCAKISVCEMTLTRSPPTICYEGATPTTVVAQVDCADDDGVGEGAHALLFLRTNRGHWESPDGPTEIQVCTDTVGEASGSVFSGVDDCSEVGPGVASFYSFPQVDSCDPEMATPDLSDAVNGDYVRFMIQDCVNACNCYQCYDECICGEFDYGCWNSCTSCVATLCV